MPTWGELIHELNETGARLKAPPFDHVRRKYITKLHRDTGRAVMLYASRWSVPNANVPIPPQFLSIAEGDVQGLMEAVHRVEQRSLDLIIHSPGGSPTAAEMMVNYLRTRFDDIRVIVPHMAMSAATMVACAGNEIVMGKHSCLGPIDPQLQINTALGPRTVPAQAILEQFERAKEECQDASKVRAWLPMLNQYGPDLLVTCKNATKLGQHLVTSWLRDYQFGGDQEKASAVAEWLSKHDNFLSHGRPIPRDELEKRGLKIKHLEDDQIFQDTVLSIFHATTLTFTETGVAKIIENHLGKAFIQQINQVQLALPVQGPPQQILLPENDPRI